MYSEKCLKCGIKYSRENQVKSLYNPEDEHTYAEKSHLTGNKCDNLQCGGDLVDQNIKLGEEPDKGVVS